MSGERSSAAPRIDEKTAERVADAMFALSSPSRVQILGCLIDGPRAVGQLGDLLRMEQSAVSHQLRVLRDLSVVRVERVGRQRVYALFDTEVALLLEAALAHVDRRPPRPAAVSDRATG